MTDERRSDPVEPTSTEVHLRRARDGDGAGCARLYEKIAPAVHAWACVRIPRAKQTRIDPRDVVQEVWWRAMDSFDRFDATKGSFRGWVFRIATHVLLEAFRDMRRSSDGGATRRVRVTSLPDDVQDEATSISRAASRSDVARRMIELMRSMNSEDRAIVVHCGLEGLSTEETAVLTGMSHDACIKRRQRLLARLRESPAWRSILIDEGIPHG